MDLDLRKLRYFVAVAERLHFGRAAAAPYITQPADVELLDRNSRQLSLTAAGKRLAEDGARLLAASQAAVGRARRVDIGFVRVSDVPPGRVVLAWDAERPPRYACELRTAARGGRGPVAL